MAEKQRKNTDGKAKRLANLKPPFPPGQSGNPAGRPQGTRNRSTVLKELLEQVLDFTNPLTLRKESADLETQIMTALIARARRGDVTAIREIQDSVYGKQSNTTLNFSPDELERLTDEELDSLIAKFNR